VNTFYLRLKGRQTVKTIILYATKHGATHEIAQRIASIVDGAVLHDLKQGAPPSLTEFDCIIVGCSLYASMIRKEAKAFLSKNRDILLNKRFGLFLCGMRAEGENDYFKANFSPDILQAAKAASFLGGIFDPEKAGAAERLIIKMVTKQIKYIDTIDDNKIAQFVDALKS
jgi:menaquinone-dependent protoporphyrinogen oxidase